MKNRDYSLDCIRIFALFTVVSVHFFLNSGFYQRPVVGISMLVQCIIRSFSYYETRKKSILVNIELYNVDKQIKNHFY